jgi:hypothetical protein
MKNTIMFFLFVLVVVGFLYAISGKKYPQMPVDANHLGVTEIAVCLECHGPGKIYPQKPILPNLNA